MTRYMGFDHGTSHCGWGVLDDTELVAYGPLELDMPYPSTLPALAGQFERMIEHYRPDVVSLEEPMALRNGGVARKLIEHYSVLKLTALRRGLGLREVTPQTLKIHAAGHGQATKEDVAWAVVKRFGVPYDKVAIPVYYKEKKRAGQVRDRLFDTSDGIGLAWAAYEIDRQTK